MPFSFVHLLTFICWPCMHAVAPLWGLPENLIAVPDFDGFAMNCRLLEFSGLRVDDHLARVLHCFLRRNRSQKYFSC